MSISTDFRVLDVALPINKIPVVNKTTMLKPTLEKMSSLRLGIACVIDADDTLLGVFTDGDVRRMLLKEQKPFAALFADDVIAHANPRPTVIAADVRLSEALRLMESKGIWDLPVVDKENHLLGLLHLHPAIKAVMGL